ncbi:MAG TPA: hypothetical protein VF543_21560 [Pyrinomonadaceae bacterium]
MAKDESRRIAPGILQADRDSLARLKNIIDYSPVNPECTVEALSAALDEMMEAQSAETRAYGALATARDNATAKEWAYHNKIMAMKDQVIAQFGRDSSEAQSVGRKKPSEVRRKRSRTTG